MNLNIKYLIIFLGATGVYSASAQSSYTLKIPVEKILGAAIKENPSLDTSIRNQSGERLFKSVNTIYRSYPDAAPAGVSEKNYSVDVPTEITQLIIKKNNKGGADTVLKQPVQIVGKRQITVTIPDFAINNSDYIITYKVSGLRYKANSQQSSVGSNYVAQKSPVTFANKVDVEDKALSIFVSSSPDQAAVFYVDIYDWNLLKNDTHYILSKLFNPIKSIQLNGRADLDEILRELAELPGNSNGIGTNTLITASNTNYIIFVLWGSPNQAGAALTLLGKKYPVKTSGQNIICFDKMNITCKN